MPKTYKGTCSECGANDQDLFPINDMDHLCPACLDDLYFFCDICKEYYHYEHWEYFDMKDGRIVCENCRDEVDDDQILDIEE